MSDEKNVLLILHKEKQKFASWVKQRRNWQRFQALRALIYFTYDILALGLDRYILGVQLSEYLEYTQKLGTRLPTIAIGYT